MVDQIKHGDGDSVLGASRLPKHKVIGGVMAENQPRDSPIIYLFGAWQNVFTQKITEALAPVFIRIFAAHSMPWICTFISLVTGKDIQISSV